MNNFKSSKLSRLAAITKTIASAGSKLAVDYALDKSKNILHQVDQKKEQVQELHYKIKAAKEIVKTMGQMKGALMKLGQMISISEDMLLPKEITELFKELQKNAPPMSDKDIDLVFIRNFKKKPEEIFQSFNRRPTASASIGQVHLATLVSGEEVAVKIQYPEIVKAIKNDFANINQLNKLIDILFPNKPNLEEFLEELRFSLVRECDYLHEKDELKRFANIFEQEFPSIIIPRPFEEYCTSEILTMNYVEGLHFDDIKHFSQDEKNIIGETLYNSFLYSLWGNQTLHTDPQYGNYLFNEGSIAILDFGSTRIFSKEFLVDYCALFVAAETDQYKLYKAASYNVNFFTIDDSDEIIQKHFSLIKALYLPYLNPGKYAVVDLEPIKLLRSFASQIEISGRESPRREFLLLDRSNLGLFTKLKSLKAEVDWVKGKNKYRGHFDELVRVKYASHFKEI